MPLQPIELDVRVIPPRDKHPSIFRAFDSLASGQSLLIVNDHDPRPLRYQFAAERPDTFDWARPEGSARGRRPCRSPKRRRAGRRAILRGRESSWTLRHPYRPE